jgi:hypothetical protein
MKEPRNLIEATSHWLNFEALCQRYELFNEGYMSYPIGQFLRERYGGYLRTEFKHPLLERRGTRGDTPRIDFVLVKPRSPDDYGSKTLPELETTIETKWISAGPFLPWPILRDLVRLEVLVNAHDDVSGYLVLAGRKKHFEGKNGSQHDRFFGNFKVGRWDAGKPLLCATDNRWSRLSIANMPPDVKQAQLKPFDGQNLPNSIRYTQIGPYPDYNSANENRVLVFGLRVSKESRKGRFLFTV